MFLGGDPFFDVIAAEARSPVSHGPYPRHSHKIAGYSDYAESSRAITTEPRASQADSSA